MCVSCCYLFRSKARNIYSPIDYISILPRRFHVSMCHVIYSAQPSHTFYYHEKISCLWCAFVVGSNDLPQYVFHRFFFFSFRRLCLWLYFGIELKLSLMDEEEEQETKMFHEAQAICCESHEKQFGGSDDFETRARSKIRLSTFLFLFFLLFQKPPFTWHAVDTLISHFDKQLRMFYYETQLHLNSLYEWFVYKYSDFYF